jgi:type VI secretion system secreted protein VgrG
MAEQEFRIQSDSPVAGELMFWSVAGHEGLSRPSVYELTVLSKNRQLDARDILGRAFDVVIEFLDAEGGKHERHCQGHAVRFMRRGQVGRYFEYRITLRSWFWLLTKRTNSRILQDKPVLEVMDAVFEDSAIKRFKKFKSGNVVGTHNPRRYCVQHQESDYQYLSRLMEDEGIYYWFDAHDAPGTMHLADSSDMAHAKLPVTDTLRYVQDGASEARFNEISRWIAARRFETGRHAARDSDFKAIRKKLGVDIDASDNHELADLEHFEFPGGYFSTEDAENTAKIRADELSGRRDRHWALTGWPDVAAGLAFKFEGDPDGQRNGEYIIAGCTFVVTHPGYEGLDAKAGATPAAELLQEALADDAVNRDSRALLQELIEDTPALRDGIRGASAFLLTVLPVEVPFKPPRLTPPVRMPGPQTAIVVGPAGEELHVDEHGRVKVQFHWDRYGQSDEKSTCWVRVSQPWAGKGWGGYFIPRIGQEVIVDFLNGDPDRPIIVGRLYNSEQPIPYPSPTQSGLRTRSTPGGNANNYNEIQFEDKKGEELLSIHAERNMARSVELDDATTVGRDQSLVVQRDQSSIVQRDQTLAVTRDRSIHVKKNESHVVDLAQKLKVGTDQDNHVVGNQTTHVDGVHTLVVKGAINTDTQATRTENTTGNEFRTIGGNQTVNITGNLAYKAAKMTFEAGHIEHKVTGANSVVHTSPNGPYTIMANKFSLLSNTDASILAVGKINQTSIENNTTVLGTNTSGYVGHASETNMGLARSTFLGLAVDTFMGAQISTTLAVQMETVAAAKISAAVGPHLELLSMKVYSPGGGAAGGPAALAAADAAVAAEVLGVLAGLSVFSAGMGFSELSDQYSAARQELRDAAQAAADAGHPGLAARLNRLSQSGGATGNDVGALTGGPAPNSTQATSGDGIGTADRPFMLPPAPGSPGAGGSGGSGGGPGGTGGGSGG